MLDNVLDIKITARENFNHAQSTTLNITQSVLFCPRKIETKGLNNISVCGLINLINTFIISAVEVMFTCDFIHHECFYG